VRVSIDDEFFGDPMRIALSRRSLNLWTLLRDNPRFAYYGRLVALTDPREDAGDILAALARVQGAAVGYFYPASGAATLFAELEARGFATDRHEHWLGGAEALTASRKALAEGALPADLPGSTVDGQTSTELVRAIAELSQSCDVMPVPGLAMRGRLRDGLCLVATEPGGRPVATASSYMMHHPASPRSAIAFWGMLATHTDRRGQKIGLRLGAQAIVHMWERHGARGFMTGVRADNASSQALCNKLGVHATEWIYAHCIDRSMFSGTITK
jgi:hypothetical protein